MIEIDIKLIKDIEEYCSINNIENPSKYVTKLLKKAFMEEKYGKKPDIFVKQEKVSIETTSSTETNIKKEEVIAIGDNMNDKEMIQEAGLGVVMGNSNPKMKELADEIVSDNNSEGVLEAINRFVLN